MTQPGRQSNAHQTCMATCKESRAERYSIFDHLPQAIRHAYAASPIDWALTPMRDLLGEAVRHRVTVDTRKIVAKIREHDARAVGAMARETYGAGHPQAEV